MSSVNKKEIIIPILIIIFIISSLIYINSNKTEIYKIEDRTNNIKEEQKNDSMRGLPDVYQKILKKAYK